jgi:hypothetical protein
MNKKEQKIIIESVINKVKEDGRTLAWLLKQLEISRTHFFFLRNGDRVLTNNKLIKIEEIIKKIVDNNK